MDIIEFFNDTYLSDTTEYKCPYFKDGRAAKAEFVFPIRDQKYKYHLFLKKGFCRSGEMFFRNICNSCIECLPLRIKLEDFYLTKSQKRILKKNKDIKIKIEKPTLVTDEKIELYKKYIQIRHSGNKDMDYSLELKNMHYGYPGTFDINYYHNDKLIGVSIYDEGIDCFYSNYFYYDPDYSKRDIGYFSELIEIITSKKMCKKYLYMGFYIKDISNMSYKKYFRPNQIFINGKWTTLSE